MNKLLIVLLAVCLVSAHAFVKRDAPAPADASNAVNDIQKTLEEFGKTISQNVQQALNPELIKEKISEIAKDVSKAVDNLAAQAKPKPAA
uniref:Uncharacterized protein n=1 Tax=Heliothis virescens TaxID=7102 RepID=A0A2A4JTT8_HELVI